VSDEPAFLRSINYVIKSFEPSPDVWAATQARAFSKWWLDLVRNLIIVGVLQFLAEKSGLWYLKAISAFTYLMFFAYCLSYVQAIMINPFHGFKKQARGLLA
jgi:hypothetical protein